MPIQKEISAVNNKKNVLVGIRIDCQSRDLLIWALVKVAEPGDCVIAVHVCRDSDHVSREKCLLDDYLEVYEGLCSAKKVNLAGEILTGSSVRRILVREAKIYDAVAVVLGMSKHNGIRNWSSTARYCSKRLPLTTDVLAIHNGKIVFRRFNNYQLLPGVEGDPRPSISSVESSHKESGSEFGESEAETENSSFELIQNSKDGTRSSDADSRCECKRSSVKVNCNPENKPGWPLLRRGSSLTSPHARKLSVVQWVMSLPDRSSQQISPRCSTIEEKPSEIREMSDIVDESIRNSSLNDLRKGLEILLKTNMSSLKWFSYEALKTATSGYSLENLIGKGGCNRVFKGIFPDGKRVAVKVMKSSKEAWKDFAHEVDIMSSLEHKHILPLLGVCIKDNDLISVYRFLSRGSLEENLHGKTGNKRVLSWEVRFGVAVRIAEALNYLHGECSRPVIHRDVKSSNILLSDKFEPQLSDFGLAIRGSTTSTFFTQGDVVGTFGYLAPEYFMYGKVSDKIDVYAFGVVLLELLTGRKPISYNSSNSQNSLVMWAKPIIENGNMKCLLDPDLDGKYNDDQMQRMVVAANLCITQSARVRPKMKEILKLLKGDIDLENWVSCKHKENEDINYQDANDDEVYPNSSVELHLNLAFLDVDEDDASVSFSSSEQNKNVFSFEEYLKERWSRSSSFNKC